VQPFTAETTLRRTYHRLNEDYQGLHALCRFFLDHTGPSHHAGEQTMLAFAVDMARLYERFVAEWLRAHLDPRWRVQPQERYTFGAEASLAFTIDLVIYDRATNAVQAVLDTKYKTPASTPSTDDIAQVIAYAQAKGAPEAVLVYPGQLEKPIDARIGKVRVRCATFALDGDLAQAGRQFLHMLDRERVA
jgi:5-methylcytosine-specific restriction enzyme subunit McrC